MNGYLTIVIVALIFLLIYLYANWAAVKEKRKRIANLKERQRIQLAYNIKERERKERAQFKLQKFNRFRARGRERSKEIQEELAKLRNRNSKGLQVN